MRRLVLMMLSLAVLLPTIPESASAGQTGIAKASFFDQCASSGRNEVDMRFTGALGVKGNVFYGVAKALNARTVACSSALQPFSIRGKNALGTLKGTCTGTFIVSPNPIGFSTAKLDCKITVVTSEGTRTGPLSLFAQYRRDLHFDAECLAVQMQPCSSARLTGNYTTQ